MIDCLRERGREKDYLWHGHYAKGTQTLYLDHNSWEDRLRAKKKLSLSPNSVTEAPQIVHSKLSRRDWLVKLCEGKQIKINGQHRPGKDSPPTYTEHILFLLVMNEQINWPWHYHLIGSRQISAVKSETLFTGSPQGSLRGIHEGVCFYQDVCGMFRQNEGFASKFSSKKKRKKKKGGRQMKQDWQNIHNSWS